MIANLFRRLWESPVGLKTTHFWGPFFNWGIVIAGIVDHDRPPEKVSGPMTFALLCYSGIFMRFAWVVIPRNLLMLSMHIANSGVQGYHLTRKINYEMNKPKELVNTSSATSMVVTAGIQKEQ